jgi:hypothetical protein
MGTLWVSLITLIAGGAVSGVATYVATRHKLVLDYDADLRRRRINTYRNLWGRLSPLAKYGRLSALTKQDVEAIAEDLRIWYFDMGGLFLSTDARSDYFALQDLLKLIDDGWGWEADGADERLSALAREQVRTYGSRLRTSLTRDVGTRSRPKTRGDVDRVDHSLAGVYEREGDGQRLTLTFRPWILGGTRRRPRLAAIPWVPGVPIDVRGWNRDQLTVRAVLEGPDRKRSERVLILEDGLIIEGPLSGQEGPAPPALWRRVPPAR